MMYYIINDYNLNELFKCSRLIQASPVIANMSKINLHLLKNILVPWIPLWRGSWKLEQE